MERIPADDWRGHAGHVRRYEYAATIVRPGDTVNDVACGVGYGAALVPPGVTYYGYDAAGVPDLRFPGVFHVADLNAAGWSPGEADVTLCFETLEHLHQPAHVAATLAATTRRALVVSVPTRPTMHANPYHLHDLTVDDIPPLFPGFHVVECWDQPDELSHVWHLARSA